MTDRSETVSCQDCVDQILHGTGDSSLPAANAEPAPLPSEVFPFETPAGESSAPASATPPNWAPLTHWQDEYQWLQEERKRLEAYTLNQFALIKQQREELLGRRAGIEETLALREQELNLQRRLSDESAAMLEQRNRELAEREAVLAEQQEKLASAQQTLQELQQSNARLQTDNEAHRLLAEQLRLHTAHLQEAVRAGRSELVILEQGIQRRKKAAEQEQNELAVARRNLEERYAVLEQAEEALRRRIAEVDQLEAQIRRELEQREHQLGMEAKQLEEAQEQLRQQLQQRREAPAELPHRLGHSAHSTGVVHRRC